VWNKCCELLKSFKAVYLVQYGYEALPHNVFRPPPLQLMTALVVISGKKMKPVKVTANGGVTLSHLGMGTIMSQKDRYVIDASVDSLCSYKVISKLTCSESIQNTASGNLHVK
jgi:hypothetical protein